MSDLSSARVEDAALKEALADEAAAAAYLSKLFALLTTAEPIEASFVRYLASVEALPFEEGRQSPAKWTVATLLPFLAQPTRFMFLKPKVTNKCADRLLFDLNYSTTLNWLTYKKLLKMSMSSLASRESDEPSSPRHLDPPW